MPRRNLNIILVLAVISIICYHRAARTHYADVFASAFDSIRSEYVEKVEDRKLFDAAMAGMLGELDQYSGYISPELKRQFDASIEQRFVGIGIEVTMDPKTKKLVIVSPLVGTPAYKAGILPGDVIVGINGESTVGWKLQDAVDEIRGIAGTPVSLTIEREGSDKPIDLTMVRAELESESVMGDTRGTDDQWNFHLEEDPRIGYIRVTQFGQHTVEELRRIIQKNKKSWEALIIDLRGNPGGLLTGAIDICDMFIDDGVIVSTRGRGGITREEYLASPGATIVPKELPVVILVDQGSASASEIFAACLQDHERAMIVGERSWGKGTVQNLIDLEGGKSALKLTTATYWRPSGKNIHRTGEDRDHEEGDWGVKPNDGFEVKLTDEEAKTLAKWRRDRDVVRVPASGQNSSASPSAEPRPDPQIQKAVEYLQSLRSKPAGT